MQANRLFAALIAAIMILVPQQLLAAPAIDVTVSDGGRSIHNRIRESFASGLISVVLGPGRGLITLEHIPRGDEILGQRDYFCGYHQPKSPYWAAVLDSATPLVSGGRFMRDWRRNWSRDNRMTKRTSPKTTAFETAEGLHRIELYPDGVGFLIRPDGLRGAFRYTEPAKPQGFVHDSHPQFVFQYGWGLEPVMSAVGDWRDRIRQINP